MMINLNKLFQTIEITPPESLARGLSRKILWHELKKPRHLFIFLTLPIGIFFAVRFIIDAQANEVFSAIGLAISNFYFSADYVVDQLSFINNFFPYQTFALMLVAFGACAWSIRSLQHQFINIFRKRHVV